MKLKKRFLALLCAVALICGVAYASSTPTIYLLAVNDKMADLPGGVLPVSVNGVIYVPYTAFDRNATGVDLGVYYGIDRVQGTLTLYAIDGMLVFRVKMGICEDGQGNRMSFRAVTRNNIPYVPAAAVCGYFGLNYSYMPTADRGTLIRITNGSVSMNDQFFLSSATGAMTYRYNNILQSMTPQPTATPVPVATPAPVPTAPGSREKVTVYLALDVSESESDDWDTYPNTLPLLFLFTPDYLVAHSDRVRKTVAKGFSIGLIVDGALEEALAELDRGNALLSHIARVRTHIVSAPAELTEGLTGEGWACWQSNVSGAAAATILANLENRRTPARLTLSASAENTAASQQVIWRIMRNEDYTIRRPLETDMG